MKSVEPETTEKVAVCRDVQEIISKEIGAIIEPLWDENSDYEYELLQSESSPEIKIAAGDIVI